MLKTCWKLEGRVFVFSSADSMHIITASKFVVSQKEKEVEEMEECVASLPRSQKQRGPISICQSGPPSRRRKGEKSPQAEPRPPFVDL